MRIIKRKWVYTVVALLAIFLCINGSLALVEDDCRICHTTGLVDVHHLLFEEGYSCLDCHDFMNISLGNARDCLICHTNPGEIDHGINCTHCHLEGGGLTVPNWNGPILTRSGFYNSVHKNITGDFNSSNYSDINMVCWGCHYQEELSRTQPPQRHPLSPRNCSNMDCHNVKQSIYNEPMIYEHFKDVDEIDENVSTAVNCPECHVNSIINPQKNIVLSNTSLVSHYGSTDDLINTTSCIYCHLDLDNAQDWGNAPDPTDNVSTLSDEEWEETLYVGDKWDLSNRYFLIFQDLTVKGDSAHLQLYLNDLLLEDIVLHEGTNYTYEEEFIDSDNNQVDCIVLDLDLISVFSGMNNTNFVTLKAHYWKRIHPENNDSTCWACHMDNYVIEKKRYVVLDEDEDEDNEIIYYVEVLLDFSEKDTPDKKILSPEDFVLKEGYNQTMQLGGGFELMVNEVDIDGKQASLTLTKNGSVVEEYISHEGDYIEYEEDLSFKGHDIDDVVVVRAKLDSVFNGVSYDAAIITEVKVISELYGIEDDEILGGYNTSQLHIDDTFSIGGTPDTFHVPLLNEGLDGGSDCVYCHEISNGFNISAVSAVHSRLGGHDKLNANAISNEDLISDINKACWACHGDGTDPGRHPPDYLYPKQCEDCHVALMDPNFNAVDISDEVHGQVEDCSRCHAADYPGLHVINMFEPLTPYIINMNVTSEEIDKGQYLTTSFTAIAGWNMKVRSMEYFIDIEGQPGDGISLEPVDGIFDEQVEDAQFSVNVSELEPGEHIIIIHSMERDNKWGPIATAEFSIESDSIISEHLGHSLLGLSILVLLACIIFWRRSKPTLSVLNVLILTSIIVLVITGSGCLSFSDETDQTEQEDNEDIVNNEDRTDQITTLSEDIGHDRECTFCHSELGHIPECTQCHDLIHGNSLPDCKKCHDAHGPLNFTGSQSYENNCGICHIKQLYEFNENPGRHADLKCDYCHLKHRQIEICINCHEPHGTDLTYHDCINCHPAHMPQQIDYPDDVASEDCRYCHEEVSIALQSGHTLHNTLECTYCHTVHALIPDCNDCHTPHTSNQTYEDCVICHDAHDPVVMELPTTGTWRDTCAACHKQIDDELQKSETKHDDLGCIYCHPEHAYLPTCDSCHGLPHKEIHESYTECKMCHVYSHAVKDILFSPIHATPQ